MKWASRWDTYLTMSDVQIHWFSIVNSVVVVFFLSGELSVLLQQQRSRPVSTAEERRVHHHPLSSLPLSASAQVS